ncbi:AGE family epimerase/isomerase [Terracoccus luteus]|uniref:Mannose/cellobiose epimerase-like protein (N-acyl-D-glucosamine 2-epimerase family) n=1 Tax=Terracoccus luteus TaxID=53356 RepID=A0A839Q0H3_9MICO|nr:AGE family epimerase/isomerase [Terracoccus luteus]MBB2987765.1 mannose/cellobiose epimerase-like protein (N-acyl-D-glucosamine 2-epimerase family) [Terracoccus luteus]MCP2173416.1 mannose/cellobiose epimerase-like protein (N-acyl-D-glucosamine 2-epimerase family) [Terracoccus luteus]
MSAPAWPDRPTHVGWLEQHLLGLLRFGRRTAADGGGAHWLDDDGAPDPSRGIQTWVTSRTVHVYSLGTLLGVPGCAPVADGALAGLTGRLRDREHGGWFSSLDADGRPEGGKSAYAHAFVVLAASSATAAGRPGAEALLAEALEVFGRRFWDADAGLPVDTWDTAFSTLDGYRGINAAMHTTEAMLAAADVLAVVLGDEATARTCRRRATGILSKVASWAAANDWRVPEHFDSQWRVQLEYNADRRDDPFKPYGATVGHGLEWARLLLHGEAAALAAGEEPQVDALASSRALFDRAVADGWSVDGRDGFVYTTDWSGAPVVRDRMHWVAAEATATAAALWLRTGEQAYADRYAQWWDHVATTVLDHEHGSWHHQLDADNRPSGTVWPGKADLYHAVGATLVPRLPLQPSLAVAVREGLWRTPGGA